MTKYKLTHIIQGLNSGSWYAPTIQTTDGNYATLQKQELIDFLQAQQDRINALACAVADKLEKGELK